MTSDPGNGGDESVAPIVPTNPAGPPASIARSSLTQAWADRVRSAPDHPALAYADSTLTAAQVDELAEATAAVLRDLGVEPGSRVGIHLQNVPQYVLLLLGLWKLGAIAVVVNPMYLGRELSELTADAGVLGVVTSDTDVEKVGASLAGTGARWVLGAAEERARTPFDNAAVTTRGLLTDEGVATTGIATIHSATTASAGDLEPLLLEPDLLELVAGARGQRVPEVRPDPDDIAVLVYTSGTTGPPKGAENTHANILAVATTFGEFAGVEAGDVVLGMAPFFHITGLVINAVVALVRDTTLVSIGRFHPQAALEAFEQQRVTYTIGSITAFNALMRLDHAEARHFRFVKTLYSGGAPISPATAERFEARFGHYLHNAYGMTETSSGVIAVPRGERAPVDPASGTLSIGVPLPGVRAEIVDPTGEPVATGEQGELVLSGPSIVPGYWHNPEATAATMPQGRLHTGDGAVIDAGGWVYLVDRLKDQINTSGYKVWPREVEDALYAHEAVYEAAVVGLPDDYRGEQVAAFVSLREGHTATAEELLEFAAARLAAYKRPRVVHIVGELPKTQTGKIRRRELTRPASGASTDTPATPHDPTDERRPRP